MTAMAGYNRHHRRGTGASLKGWSEGKPLPVRTRCSGTIKNIAPKALGPETESQAVYPA